MRISRALMQTILGQIRHSLLQGLLTATDAKKQVGWGHPTEQRSCSDLLAASMRCMTCGRL